MGFTLQNCGATELVIIKLQLMEDSSDTAVEFAVDWSPLVAAGQVGPGPITAANPLTIPKYSTATLVVSYSPANVTPKGQMDTGKLLVEFSHGAQVVLPLTGRGVAQPCPAAVVKVAEGSEVVPQTNLHLQGSLSLSPIGGKVVKYLWTVTQPAGSNQPLLPSATFPNPTLTANAAGLYQFCLDVWDDQGVKSCKPKCAEVLVAPPQGQALHIELLWDTPTDPDQTDSGPAAGADLDLHFAHPLSSGTEDIDCDGKGDPWFDNLMDMFWFTPLPDWGAAYASADNPSLDLDDTDGAGPENLNLEAPEGTLAEPAAYSVGVHYWSDHGYGPSTATVAIYLYGTLAVELKAKLKPLDMWYVGKLTWPNTLSGGSAKPFATCYQSGYSCPAGKNLTWAAKGDFCVTPCYYDKSFSTGISAGTPSCTPGFP